MSACADQPLVVIPARLDSSRLPRKALAEIQGTPMLAHVIAAALAAAVGPVVAAVDGPELAQVAEAAGARAVLTDPALPSGSDRVAAAVRVLDPEGTHAHIINLQGDMPFFPPEFLRALAAACPASDCDLLTLCAPLESGTEADPNRVKAAVAFPEAENAKPQRVLYFSRAPVPWGEGTAAARFWGHIGVYAWKRTALEKFIALPSGALETSERLEQLRALEAGLSIFALAVDSFPRAVDTAADLAFIRSATTNPPTGSLRS